jgi:putative flippase GtrA
MNNIIKKDVIERRWGGFVQFFKFGIVGLSNTIIGYVIYAVSLKILRYNKWFSNCDIYMAQLVMFLLSVAWSFFWNNRIVFKKKAGVKRNILAALLKTYISYALTSLLLSEILLMFWVRLLGINGYVAPAINLLITVPLNFIIQKYWAFK